MKTLATILLCCIAATSLGAETIDRVVATVNGRPVLQSDLYEAVRYEAFVDNKPLSSVDAAEVRNTLDQLIDQELIREQMGTMAPEVTSETVQEKLAEIRKQHGSTPEQWRAALAAYGLDEASLTARLETQLRTLNFLDSRLRPSIVIDRAAVETYYKNTLLPEVQKSGATQPPAYNDVQHDIREILTQQKIDEMLVTWLHNLRQQSRIRVLMPETQVATATGNSSTK
jgi:SurA N-terminal domain